jgi:hypothetical protein
MSKDRLETFSDGVIAILITIMAVESRTPRGTTWAAVREGLRVLLAVLGEQPVEFVVLRRGDHLPPLPGVLRAAQPVAPEPPAVVRKLAAGPVTDTAGMRAERHD